jgi:hypothetical protein
MIIGPRTSTQNTAGNEARYEIETMRVNTGHLPRRAHSLVIEWADIHRDELLANWHRARRGEPLIKIEPLD